MNSSNEKGVTLVELLIAVAIMGILGAIAYPSYVNYVTKSKRAEPQRELARLANLMEQYFIDHRTYTSDMKLLGTVADPYVTESGNYTIDTSVQTVNTYTLTATVKSGGAQAANDSACATMSIDHTGKKTATSTTCWEK